MIPDAVDGCRYHGDDRLHGFHLGVEVGRLAIVAAPALPTALVARSPNARLYQRLISATIALCGLGWFLDRLFNLELMPF